MKYGAPRATYTGADDPEAGELGKPFTQLAGFGDGEKGDQEEWAGWVDWDALAGGAAGGSGRLKK